MYSQSQGNCQDSPKKEQKNTILLQSLLAILIYPVYFWYYFYTYERQKAKVHGREHGSSWLRMHKQ